MAVNPLHLMILQISCLKDFYCFGVFCLFVFICEFVSAGHVANKQAFCICNMARETDCRDHVHLSNEHSVVLDLKVVKILMAEL